MSVNKWLYTPNPLLQPSAHHSMGSIKNYVTCIMTLFIPLTCATLYQFYCITTSVLFTKNNKLWNKRKGYFFVYMATWAYDFISKEVENRIFRNNRILRHTCMYKQPIQTMKWNYKVFVQILYSYLRYNESDIQ